MPLFRLYREEHNNRFMIEHVCIRFIPSSLYRKLLNTFTSDSVPSPIEALVRHRQVWKFRVELSHRLAVMRRGLRMLTHMVQQPCQFGIRLC